MSPNEPHESWCSQEARTERKPSARMHACALLALRCKNLKREARAPVRHSIQCRLDCWTPFFLQSPAFNSIPPPACLQMQSCLDSCCSPALLHPHTSLSYSRLGNATPFSNCLHIALHCIILYSLSIPLIRSIISDYTSTSRIIYLSL